MQSLLVPLEITSVSALFLGAILANSAPCQPMISSAREYLAGLLLIGGLVSLGSLLWMAVS